MKKTKKQNKNNKTNLKKKKRKKYITKSIRDEKALYAKINELSKHHRKLKQRDTSNEQSIYVPDKDIESLHFNCKYLKVLPDSKNIFICTNPDAVKYYRDKLNFKHSGDFLLVEDIKNCKFNSNNIKKKKR